MKKEEWIQLEKEAVNILKEIEKDLSLKDVKAPEELKERLMDTIEEYEEDKKTERFLEFIFEDSDN